MTVSMNAYYRVMTMATTLSARLLENTLNFMPNDFLPKSLNMIS